MGHVSDKLRSDPDSPQPSVQSGTCPKFKPGRMCLEQQFSYAKAIKDGRGGYTTQDL